MRYPELTEESTFRQVTDTFLGYNHNIKLRDGEFYNTENLTSKFYPMLAVRQKRSVVTDSLTAAQGMIEKTRSVMWITGRFIIIRLQRL